MKTKRMNRREFLRAGGCSAALLSATGSWGFAAQNGKAGAGDRELLSEADEQIQKYRKGDALVTVRSAAGPPVAGARVKIEQLRHDFLFGCNLFMFGRCGDPEREQKYRDQFAAVFNYCTLGFYWATYESERGRPNYDYTDSVLQWTRAHGITAKGHPLVWDHPAGSPRWLPDDQAEIARLSNERVRTIVSRFRDRLRVWDVVNEATHLPDKVNQTKMAALGLSKGAVRYTAEPLEVARAANPEALLLVNDYRTDPPYFELLQNLAAQGKALFDVVGIQSHMHGGAWPLRQVRDVCDRFSKLGRPLHFTETTIVSGPRAGERWGETTPAEEAKQAERAADFYRVLFGHPAVQAVTWWDFSDYHAWQGAAAGWLRQDMSPKPAYDRVKSLIKKEWSTQAEGQTGPLGKFNTRAFYGNYRVTVEPPAGAPVTREVHWERGGASEVVVEVQER